MEKILELLKEIFSATEEQTKSFTDAMKAKKIYTASEENLDVRYGKLKNQHDTQGQQLKDALAKIATLESGVAGSETMQQELAAAKTENETLKAQLAKAQVEAQAHVALLTAGVKPDDIDYVMFKMQAKGDLEQGEDGKIKGLDDKIAALKTQFPNQFTGEGKRKYQEQRLPDGKDHEEGEPSSLADALRMQYES